MSENDNDLRETLITLTSDIVAAHVSNNSVAVGDLATLISNVYNALAGLKPAEPAAEPTPEQYRARWNLPADYPMVAPAYAEKRRELAKKIGLGRKPAPKRGRAKAAS